eukprot:2816579-Prymnesium_polylepis.1
MRMCHPVVAHASAPAPTPGAAHSPSASPASPLSSAPVPHSAFSAVRGASISSASTSSAAP